MILFNGNITTNSCQNILKDTKVKLFMKYNIVAFICIFLHLFVSLTLGLFGQTWKTIEKDFTPKKYGYKKLSDLIKDKTDFFQYKIGGNRGFKIKLKNNLRS